MVRAPCFDEHGLKRGAWSEDEDNKLRAYIQQNGHPNWRRLPKLAGLSRCGKSCRLRWMNYLRPNLKHGNFSKEEEDVIINLHKKIGTRWSVMAKQLPGRSDNEIKNHWHAHLKNRAQKDQTVLKEDVTPKECRVEKLGLNAQPEVETLLAVLSSSNASSDSLSPACSLNVSDYAIPSDVTPQFSELAAGNLWTDPFLSNNDNVNMASSSDYIFSPLEFADGVDHLLEFLR